MQKIITPLLLSCICTFSFGQKLKPVSLYLLTQYNQTINDATKGNNPWSIGLGLQAFVNLPGKIKPTVELTGDGYLMDDKVLRLDSLGKVIENVDGMVNLFAGISFSPVRFIAVSVTGGPSFLGSQTRIGVKPALAFYFPRSKKWTAKISYIHIFDRDKATREDFNSMSFSVGFKLF